MPLYVYVCGSCGNQFERLREFAQRLDPSACPKCTSEARFALSLSTPGFVGAAAAESCGSPEAIASGGCCGDGACGRN
ncbi:MAG: FmdB family zinc ribbon protein [Gemmatimonadota bacterium]